MLVVGGPGVGNVVGSSAHLTSILIRVKNTRMRENITMPIAVNKSQGSNKTCIALAVIIAIVNLVLLIKIRQPIPQNLYKTIGFENLSLFQQILKVYRDYV